MVGQIIAGPMAEFSRSRPLMVEGLVNIGAIAARWVRPLLIISLLIIGAIERVSTVFAGGIR